MNHWEYAGMRYSSAAPSVISTGVGLANAHKVVVSHGGSLALDSTPGPGPEQGCVFRVHLPAAGPAVAGDAGGASAETAA